MFRRRFLKVTGASMAVGAAGVTAIDAAQPQYTWIFVDGMHCEFCARRLAKGLSAVPGVAKVETSVPKKFAVVTPASGKQLSPKAVWEAAEKAKFKPVKLQGPTGVYKKKPGA